MNITIVSVIIYYSASLKAQVYAGFLSIGRRGGGLLDYTYYCYVFVLLECVKSYFSLV